jgi:hypothetical protein
MQNEQRSTEGGGEQMPSGTHGPGSLPPAPAGSPQVYQVVQRQPSGGKGMASAGLVLDMIGTLITLAILAQAS